MMLRKNFGRRKGPVIGESGDRNLGEIPRYNFGVPGFVTVRYVLGFKLHIRRRYALLLTRAIIVFSVVISRSRTLERSWTCAIAG